MRGYNKDDEISAKKIINSYLYEHRYDEEYLAYEYPPSHPYFKYMCEKYDSLKNINSRNIDLLSEHYKYLESINASEFELDKIDEKIHNLENINSKYDLDYIWSDDEEEVDFINDYVEYSGGYYFGDNEPCEGPLLEVASLGDSTPRRNNKKKINLIYRTKREIEFNKLDKEELAQQAFAPKRVAYILSLDPEYEF
jgi:hypothetical protein